MTPYRSRQRQCARLGAMFIAIGALLSVVTIESAAASVATDEPTVQIGESRSIERSGSTVAPATDGVDSSVAGVAVAGVAVAGVAIARDAPPVAYRMDLATPHGGTNPLPFFVGGLFIVAAMVAVRCLRLRRLRTITA